MREQLVAFFEANHKLVEPDALELLLTSPQPIALSREIVARLGGDSPFVTTELVTRLVAPPRLDITESISGGVASPTAASPPRFELVGEGFSPPTGSDPLGAYRELFSARFRELSRLLRGRSDLPGVVTIPELRRRETECSVIGMIRSVRQTAEKRHTILTLEDAEGSAEVFVARDLASRALFIPDEVIGVRLSFSRERSRLPRAVAVVRPDISARSTPGTRSGCGSVLFLSDLHIGSRSFLSEEWEQLAEFLRGKGDSPDLAADIEFVVVAGDLVDGIGVYPNQERDLAIHDIFEQYRELGRRLRDLPDRLTIVIIPGNHDAVCPAEPQPGLPREIRADLPTNVRSLGNPSTFSLHGVIVEAYHGRSFDDLIPAIPGASYSRPTEVMRRMLQMRHLAPIYGGRTPLAPMARDGLVVEQSPDILVTGHAHTFGADQYRGSLLLNASTWQAETEYQRMRNIDPVPAQAAVVRLSDLKLTRVDFSSPRPEAIPSPS